MPGLTGVEIDTSSGCDQPDGNPDPEAIPDSIREKPWHGWYRIYFVVGFVIWPVVLVCGEHVRSTL